jgi:polyhydroxyalkanoate synthase
MEKMKNETNSENMVNQAFLMYESAAESALHFNEKLLRGMEMFAGLEYDDINKTPKDLVFQIDKTQLYRYRSENQGKSTPLLLVYALMNKQYIMDLQQDKSFVKKLVEFGFDVYIIDWCYPTAEDQYITTEDYIEEYIGAAVNYILKTHNITQLNLVGKCQGGTFGAIYASLHPEQIKNLVTIAAPFDFDIKDGLLFYWSKFLDVDMLVNAYSVLPGDFLNNVFIMLSPYHLSVGKYINIVNSFDDPKALGEFLRMEKWLFDCPDQAGANYRTWIKELWQQNKLIKGEFVLGDKKIDLKNINMPLLNVIGTKDNLIPPSSSKVINDVVSSKDKELISFPVGHAGIVASGLSQREIVPKIAEWLNKRNK